MWNESYTLPSHKKLRNRSYSIMLNCIYSLSTPQIHLPHTDPTISLFGSYPAFSLPQYTYHKWFGMPPVPLWLPVVSRCTPVWDINIVQCWCTCEVDEEKWAILTVLFYLDMMYKHYSCLGFSPIKNKEEWKYIHNKIFNNIPHFIKNRFHIDCIQDGFICKKIKY